MPTLRDTSLVSLVLPALTWLAPLALAGEDGASRGCAEPRNYCFDLPSSAGPGAGISWTGTPSLVTDDFHLVATGCPPGQFLMFYYGAGRTVTAFGNGWRCVSAGGVGIFRFKPFQIDASGAAVMKVDFTKPPAGTGGGLGQWLPGDTWHCQAWYRDPAGGGAQFNLSDALEVPICLDGPYEGMASIPAGEFEMGDHHGVGNQDELPVHTVQLDAFFMDVYEVTNQQYADYLNTAYAEGRITISAGVVYQAGGAGEALCDTRPANIYTRISWNGTVFTVVPGKETHPMLLVSWFGACTYANQRSRDFGLDPCYDETSWDCDFGADGYRLPTEAEWEYAARGGAHDPYYKYPWGDQIDGSTSNYLNSGDPFESQDVKTSPVGYYDGGQSPPGVDMANGYGLYDVAGNVSEWCWDWWAIDYYSRSPLRNPTGPTSGTYRIRRGGGWRSSTAYLRASARTGHAPVDRLDTTGFRVVLSRP